MLNQSEPDSRPSSGTRFVLAIIASGMLTVFLIAFWLKPDPRGFGTHQQLGLPPCQFRQFLGVSCPHCGMTTSFSNFVRGNFHAAHRANPLGIPLAITWAFCVPWCFSVAITGRWIGTTDPFHWLVFGTIFYLILAFGVWVSRGLT